MNILIFSVAAGGGHNAVANTIKDNLIQLDETVNVQVVDTLHYINKALHKVIIGSYLETIKYMPKLYGHLYDSTETWEKPLSNVSEISYKILSLKLKKLIDDFQPDKIICTHPFPSEMIAGAKKSGKIETKMINVLTDFTAHPMWINKWVDYYIVASKGLQYEMEEYEVEEQQILPFGIPIRDGFHVIKGKESVRLELGLQDKITVLVMGGSLGFGDLKDTVIHLLQSNLDLQFLIVCGQNHSLYRKLKKYEKEGFFLYSYVENVYDLMDASDFIITKPGGITIAEAMCKELPMIFTSPIPGQEARNIDYLLNNGVAVKPRDKENVATLIKQLINDPERVEAMKLRCKQMRRPDAGKQAAQFILNEEA